MKRLLTLFTVILAGMLLTAGAGCIDSTEKSSPGYKVVWIGTSPAEHKAIETKITRQISPHPGVEYDNVTVSASKENDMLRIHVIAISASSQYPDLYDFTYRNGDLMQVGYLLEAIPESVRSDGINVAVQSEAVMSALGSGMGAYGTPSVKRILPETSAKFYAAKSLLSVTWTDNSVSALVDMDTRQVVQVWNGE